ncbi:MAG: ATP-binding protein [Thermoanaerobaculia bacterium]
MTTFRSAVGKLRGHLMPLPVAVVGVGVAALALLVGSDWLRERLLREDLTVSQVLSTIKNSVTSAHLWVEEYVTGDTVDPQQIDGNLDQARELTELLLLGGKTDGGFVLPALEDSDLKLQALELRSGIERLASLSLERQQGYSAGKAVGVGSPLDVTYDQVFDDVAGRIDRLEQAFTTRLSQAHNRSRLIFRGLLVAWTGLLAVGAVALTNHGRRRRAAESALRASEERLLRSQKLEAVGRLAGGVAHDINNYLAAITGHCELVRMREEPGSRTARKMDEVIQTALSASSLIKRLLAFSRRQPMQLEVVDLNRAIHRLEPMIRRLIGEDIDLHLSLAGELWAVKIDPAQLEQVVVNLLVNAREAMPRGGKVTVETANVPGGPPQPGSRRGPVPDSILLAVTDTGPGIPPEVQARIFEPFFTTKEESGSSGLGLATVYGIIEQHGGCLGVYSEPGYGACFKIYLPRASEPATEQPKEAPREVMRRGDERILLVEDNAEFRTSAAELLVGLGYEVQTAANGNEALSLVNGAESLPGLLITDVVMPGMSGRELVDRLSAKGASLPVLYVSGYTDNVVLNHGVLEGEVEFLQKPFTALDLARKVRTVLDRQRNQRQARAETPPS